MARITISLALSEYDKEPRTLDLDIPNEDFALPMESFSARYFLPIVPALKMLLDKKIEEKSWEDYGNHQYDDVDMGDKTDDIKEA